MISILRMPFAVAGAAVIGIALCKADTRSNPYLSIVERNPFGIKPPPPPPPPPETSNPVLPLAKVVLTGVTSIIGPPRALLEITEQEPGKGPTVNKRILKEGERDGSIEVISIDVVNNSVRIKNGTVETNVVFEVAKQGSPGPGVPGAMPSPTGMPTPAPALPVPTVTSASSGTASPMIISSRGADAPGRANTGVASYGAEASSVSPSSSYGNSGYRMASVNTYGAVGSGLTRPLRGDAAANPGEQPVSLEQNIKNFLEQAETAKRNGGYIPHTETTPRPRNKSAGGPPGAWVAPPMPGFDDPSIPTPGAQ